MHKMAGDIWDAKRLGVLVQKSLFCLQKPQMKVGPIETSDSDAKHAVVHAQNDRSYLGPIETCYSGPEVAVLHAKTTDEGCDP